MIVYLNPQFHFLQVAAEITGADELVVTELVFGGVFNDLSLEQLVALCSCFVWTEKGDGSSGKLREELSRPLGSLKNAARRVAKVSVECKMEMDVEE